MSEENNTTNCPSTYNHASRKCVGMIPLFDPMKGTVVVEPPGQEEGYWAGGPSAVYDDRSDKFYLSYRLRTKLLEHGLKGRGGETAVAVSPDGKNFEKIWTGYKEDFEALSIEKSSIIISPEGKFRLYVSSISKHDFRWHIDMLEAESPEQFDTTKRIEVLSPGNTGTEGVKDPVTMIVGGLWHMYVNMAPVPQTDDWGKFDRMHRTGNAFVSGEVACSTGLATSPDGIHFNWVGEVIPCGDAWDRYLARISTLIYTPPCFTAIYDGRPNSGANYSDSPGLAITTDLRTFHKIDVGHGLLHSPYGHGTLRYIEAVQVGGTLHYFYEMDRQDFAHELRTIAVELT